MPEGRGRGRRRRRCRSPLRLSIADTLTLGNATCGFMAVYFTTTGILIPHLTGSDETGMARHSAATAVILMLLRGRLRPLRRSGGPQAAQLADGRGAGQPLRPDQLRSRPGVLRAGLRHGRRRRPPARWRRSAAIVVLLAVVLRLARFSCVTDEGRHVPGHAEPLRRADGRLDRAARAALRADAAGDHRHGVADGEPGRVPQAAGPSSRWRCSAGSCCDGRCWRPGRSTPPAVSCCSRPAARCRS